VAGGYQNTASGIYATVPGGVQNAASGDMATAGGGSQNLASGQFATVAGGELNTASAIDASVSGGIQNTASAYYATVPGGFGNVAGGKASFAAGSGANAVNDYTFVWSDGSTAPFSSTAPNQFLIQASGGVGIDTASTPENDFCINANTYLFSHATYLRGENGADHNHGLAYCGPGVNNFAASVLPDGPVLWGFAGGALGVVNGGNKAVLTWDTSGVSVPVLTITGGSDLAEPFEMSGAEMPKGSVVVIDEDHPGRLKLADQPYDHRVAGIISGANGVKPGISLHQSGVMEGDQNVALSGRVYVQADAANGAIHPGDLLTTSSTPGHAMKVTDHLRAQGAVLGKAMTGLSEGKGLVLVLVTLQ